MESKNSIYKLIPPRYYPETLFFQEGAKLSQVKDRIYRQHFSYPMIAKPDIGMKGMAVQKLETEDELSAYIANAKFDFLIQEFVSYPNEAGIFYYRLPGEKTGHISGIVGKEFLTVQGNGVSTIRELLKNNKRYVLQLPILQKTYGDELDTILKAGKEVVLVPYGNHVRGAKFVDISHLANDQLTNVIDKLCQSIDGFYYGRLDIRYESWEDLCAGKNFSVIEVNGAGSEPTHIYDPRHSIFFAWKEIVRHWTLLWKISRINQRQSKAQYMNTRAGLNMLRESRQYVRMIEGQIPNPSRSTAGQIPNSKFQIPSPE